jgi:hypothetical protein
VTKEPAAIAALPTRKSRRLNFISLSRKQLVRAGAQALSRRSPVWRCLRNWSATGTRPAVPEGRPRSGCARPMPELPRQGSNEHLAFGRNSPGMSAQCHQGNCRIIQMSRERLPIDHAIAGVPSAGRAGPIQEHLNPRVSPHWNLFQSATGTGELIKCQDGKRRGHDPTDGVMLCHTLTSSAELLGRQNGGQGERYCTGNTSVFTLEEAWKLAVTESVIGQKKMAPLGASLGDVESRERLSDD